MYARTLNFGLAAALFLRAVFAISVLLEGEAEVLEQRACFLVVLGAGHHGDVHATLVVDRIRIDLMEHGLLGEAKVVVALTIELVAVDATEIADTRQSEGQQAIQELFDKIDRLGIEIKEINRRRAIRALELYRFSENLENTETTYDPYLIGLDDERSLIYDRINTRVDKMVEHGLLEEAKWLYDNYPDAQSARGIGYKELFPYFAGNQSLDEALEKLKQNTRRFAKRQLTWFRNRMTVKFYQISSPEYPENVVQDLELFLNEREGEKVGQS